MPQQRYQGQRRHLLVALALLAAGCESRAPAGRARVAIEASAQVQATVTKVVTASTLSAESTTGTGTLPVSSGRNSFFALSRSGRVALIDVVHADADGQALRDATLSMRSTARALALFGVSQLSADAETDRLTMDWFEAQPEFAGWVATLEAHVLSNDGLALGSGDTLAPLTAMGDRLLAEMLDSGGSTQPLTGIVESKGIKVDFSPEGSSCTAGTLKFSNPNNHFTQVRMTSHLGPMNVGPAEAVDWRLIDPHQPVPDIKVTAVAKRLWKYYEALDLSLRKSGLVLDPIVYKKTDARVSVPSNVREAALHVEDKAMYPLLANTISACLKVLDIKPPSGLEIDVLVRRLSLVETVTSAVSPLLQGTGGVDYFAVFKAAFDAVEKEVLKTVEEYIRAQAAEGVETAEALAAAAASKAWSAPAQAVLASDRLANYLLFIDTDATLRVDVAEMFPLGQCPRPPLAPKGLTALAGPLAGSVELRWTGEPDAVGYRVYYAETAFTSPMGVRSIDAAGSPQLVTGLAPGQTWFFSVTALNPAGESLAASQVSLMAPLTSSADAGAPDGGGLDSGIGDAGSPDGGPVDAGAADAGAPDAGAGDAGSNDAGAGDAGEPDAGTGDAGAGDAGAPDAGPGLVFQQLDDGSEATAYLGQQTLAGTSLNATGELARVSLKLRRLLDDAGTCDGQTFGLRVQQTVVSTGTVDSSNTVTVSTASQVASFDFPVGNGFSLSNDLDSLTLRCISGCTAPCNNWDNDVRVRVSSGDALPAPGTSWAGASPADAWMVIEGR